MTKGTAVSPPLFLLIAMALALVMVGASRRRGVGRIGAGLASAVGAVATVGTLGELLAPATPDVPRGAQLSAVVGVVLSVAVLATGIAFLRASLKKPVPVESSW